ncbi:hypothetical protein ACJX0J_011474, partial [Zea mays]
MGVMHPEMKKRGYWRVISLTVNFVLIMVNYNVLYAFFMFIFRSNYALLFLFIKKYNKHFCFDCFFCAQAYILYGTSAVIVQRRDIFYGNEKVIWKFAEDKKIYNILADLRLIHYLERNQVFSQMIADESPSWEEGRSLPNLELLHPSERMKGLEHFDERLEST